MSCATIPTGWPSTCTASAFSPPTASPAPSACRPTRPSAPRPGCCTCCASSPRMATSTRRRDPLTSRTVELLQVPPALVEAAITRLDAAEYIAVEGASALAHPRPEDACEAVYLKALHVSEIGVANLLKALCAWPARPLEVDVDRAISWAEGRQSISLAPEQKEAVRQAMASKVLVITGGPGTGKTTLVNVILSILEKKGRRILLVGAHRARGQAAGRDDGARGEDHPPAARVRPAHPRLPARRRQPARGRRAGARRGVDGGHRADAQRAQGAAARTASWCSWATWTSCRRWARAASSRTSSPRGTCRWCG